MAYPLIPSDSPRILVICVARFGDTLLITPTLAALKQHWPKAHLTVLAHPGRVEVLEHLSFIDKLASITKLRARWSGWALGKRYDLALVYGEEKALARFARRVASHVIGFSGRDNAKYELALTESVPRPGAPMIAAAERSLLLGPLGINSVSNLHLHYVVSAEEAEEAASFIRKSGWGSCRLVGLQLQSFPTKAYRDWPMAHFVELAKKLLDQYHDIQIVLLGGPESCAVADEFQSAFENRVSNVAGRFTMRQNAALISNLALYIGVDTGPTHLAGALDIPMVAMYHCFHPGRFLAPQLHPALTVVDHPASQPSREASMAEIPVETVFAAACAYLDRK
ncbi:glycosyltransferase family 9 protein [Azonexus sp. IMCC34839]|uniref:glycosyltransferase family 9 protein n=1 Tax=Azonexus sp. IMCC34839 TaxID=3133695 RepID=UPI0039995771